MVRTYVRPDYSAARVDALSTVARAAICTARASFDPRASASQLARRDFPQDRSVETVLRSAQSPTTTSSGVTQVAQSFLAALAQQSAGADLLGRAIALSFGGAASILAPSIGIPTADFIGEGKPIAVKKATTGSGVTLTPSKIAAAVVLSNELLASSNAEELVKAVLVESVAPTLDAVLFSTNAATADHPAGLRYNIAGLTPSTGGTETPSRRRSSTTCRRSRPRSPPSAETATSC